MKKNIFIKGLAGLMTLAMASSCSSDYLDVDPITSLDDSILSSIEGAQSAMVGAYRSMYCAYEGWELRLTGVTGESWVQSYYGDATGVDAFYYIWSQYGPGLMNWDNNTVKTYWMCDTAWRYYYNLINQANKILQGLEGMTSGTEAERAAVKAQALAMRAHGYERLLQIYGPRWADADGGSKYVLVLRTVPGVDELDLSTEKDVLDLIYKDLTEAIQLFAESGFRQSQLHEIDANVAHGIFARAAMICNDWQTAYDHAKAARAGHDIMTADQYKDGFVYANQEYMWSNTLEEQYTGTWDWGNVYTVRGAYATFAWNCGAGAINYDLYRMMDSKDMRRDLYYTPDFSGNKSVNVRRTAFWNSNYIDEVTMNCNGKNANMKRAIQRFVAEFPENAAKYGTPYADSQNGSSFDKSVIPFGAQMKFWGEGLFCNTQFPYMRAAEMALYEAEAAAHLQRWSDAQQALIDINSKRIEGYACTKTGQDLLDEIMLTSRVELWGEGHSWFNQKRWNVTVERRAWEAGVAESGNVPKQFAMKKAPQDRGWIYCIPNAELQFNHAIDIKKLIVNGTSGNEDDSDEEGGEDNNK